MGHKVDRRWIEGGKGPLPILPRILPPAINFGHIPFWGKRGIICECPTTDWLRAVSQLGKGPGFICGRIIGLLLLWSG